MSIDLSPQNEQYIQDSIARGTFQTRGEALDAAVELLRLRDETIREVNIGIDELERGEGRPLDMSKIKERIAMRLAQRSESR